MEKTSKDLRHHQRKQLTATASLHHYWGHCASAHQNMSNQMCQDTLSDEEITHCPQKENTSLKITMAEQILSIDKIPTKVSIIITTESH